MTDETQGLTTEDARIIAAAAADRRISPDNIHTWCAAMRADREGTRRVLASLPKAWTRTRTVAAATPVSINGSAGREPTVTGGGATPPPAPAAELDAFGFPKARTPEPVRISKGVNPADYTREQQYQAFAHMLGGKFTQGVPRPPAGDTYYAPSPHDTYRWVDNGDGTGQFEPKAEREYREI
jgi:hypothetical protein